MYTFWTQWTRDKRGFKLISGQIFDQKWQNFGLAVSMATNDFFMSHSKIKNPLHSMATNDVLFFLILYFYVDYVFDFYFILFIFFES